MNIGRNKPCPCGSGKKFKHCHGKYNKNHMRMAAYSEAKERIRRRQQGGGRPVISLQSDNHQIVAVGKSLYWSRSWKTFIDFLGEYIKRTLGGEWGNIEIGKPFSERHPILQWYEELCLQQKESLGNPGDVRESNITGAVAAYYSVAYGLYLLDHNVELQDRMVRRLKDRGQFQGAYYELIVASMLLRAGFDLTLEDETDIRTRHCEFSAISKKTGKKYWIEAKMRAVVDLLGRTAADGTTSSNPISQLVPHLNGALAKPSTDERMIFIDLNADIHPDVSEKNPPPFMRLATRRLERYELKELELGQAAYVFVTNISFHRDLKGPAQFSGFSFGLGISDFNRPGFYSLSEYYKQRRRHIDALIIEEAFSRMLQFPSTFDGSLPNVAFHNERPPLTIGERYCFEGAGPDGSDLYGMVSDAVVIESEMAAYVVVSTDAGQSYILKNSMTVRQIDDYRSHPDEYFGVVLEKGKKVHTAYELFEFFMKSYSNLSYEEIIALLPSDIVNVKPENKDDALLVYCEYLVATSNMFKDAQN